MARAFPIWEARSMTHIPPLRSMVGARIVDARELDRAPRALVNFGQSPDGLPWLCDVDRSSRIDMLYRTIAELFDVERVEDLPTSVREATEGALARGLMGVHSIDLDERGPMAAFVTRRSARGLFGPTVLEQLLSPETAKAERNEHETMAVTSASAIGMAEALDQAIETSKSGRHVLLTLGGETWTAMVTDANRALRVPAGPYRRAVFESLAALAGTTAKVSVGFESWMVSVSDTRAYIDALMRAGEAPGGGQVSFEVPRATLLRILVGVAQLVGDLHRRGIVHGDLTPGNVLLDGGKPISADALHVEAGQIAAAATFEWAAPEQIVGRPLDPRADVYALGKMMCALVGAVPFGEKIEYVVPTGGDQAKTVQLLKTDGVFIDAKALGVNREWQARWQDTLGKLLAYDREKRFESGVAAMTALGELLERFPPPGSLPVAGHFGTIAPVQRPAMFPLARVVSDG
ncbi:MAG TPA: phosphotransferase [Kofleriaceae bacterium]|nr:phosphotransferase [Kofleriaceae bacterium]